MLVFNELRIDEKKHLIVDASILQVETGEDLSDIHISDILIGFGSKDEVTNYYPPSEHTGAFTRLDVVDNVLKGFRLNLELEDNANQLIYVKIAQTRTALMDCTEPDSIEGYVYDKCLIMEKIFDYVKTTDCCGDITNYANYIVKTMGLEKAIEGGNFNLANKYWQKFFMNNNSILTSNCGCNG